MSDTFDPSTFTWICDVCKSERPDDKIDVAYRPLRGMESMFPNARFNLKYCNDNYECIAEAHGPGPWPKEADT